MSYRYRTSLLTVVSTLLALTTVSATHAQKETDKIFQAGAAAVNITPPLGSSLCGSMRDRTATHVHDELFARSLVLENETGRIAFVVCDIIAIAKETVAQAKGLIQTHTGISPDRVLIAATHTHTAPTPAPLFQSDPDPEYLADLVVKISDSVRRAVNNLQPARIGWGAGQETRVVFNRRFHMKEGTMPEDPWGRTDDTVKTNPGYKNPNIVKTAGPIDPEIPLLSVQSTDGTPIAVLGNYALHYVGGNPGSDVSADYIGQWAGILSREFAAPASVTQPPFVPMLTNGCSGNINNVDTSQRLQQPHLYHQMHHVARLVADETLRVLETIEYRDWVPLAACGSVVELGRRKPTRQEVDEAQRILEGKDVLKSMPEIYARETVLMAEMDDVIQTEVQAIRIGDVAVVTFPGEAFVELGLEIKAKSPFDLTFCIELANDYVGYIPTPIAYERGGYETWRARSSPLQTDSAPRLVSTGLALLDRLASEKGGN